MQETGGRVLVLSVLASAFAVGCAAEPPVDDDVRAEVGPDGVTPADFGAVCPLASQYAASQTDALPPYTTKSGTKFAGPYSCNQFVWDFTGTLEARLWLSAGAQTLDQQLIEQPATSVDCADSFMWARSYGQLPNGTYVQLASVKQYGSWVYESGHYQCKFVYFMLGVDLTGEGLGEYISNSPYSKIRLMTQARIKSASGTSIAGIHMYAKRGA